MRKRSARQDDREENGPDAIIIKTKQNPLGKQPTVIPLTKEQIDAVLRSLKVAVPVQKKTVVSDATTQSSPPVDQQMEQTSTFIKHETNIKQEKMEPEVMKEINEKTPVITINTPDKGIKRPVPSCDTIPMEKRVKLTFSSPSDEQSPVLPDAVSRFKKKAVDTAKPSPQRALHLAPEFNKPKNSMLPSGDAPGVEIDDKSHKKIEIIINESVAQTVASQVKTGVVASSTSLKPGQVMVQFAGSPRAGTVFQTGGNKNATVVQLSNQPTILQLPVVSMAGARGDQTLTLSPGMQILQSGQQLIQVPGSQPGSPRVITYTIPASLGNVQLVSTQSAAATTLVKPIATKPPPSPQAGSQIVAPQIVRNSPVYIHTTSGSFLPVSNSTSSVPKVLLSSSNLSLTELPTSAVRTRALS